jgi:DHA1 family multidrug resistance protein-like MFS transporter
LIKGANRRQIIILFFTLVVVMLGFGMVIPILPFLIESLGASGSELGLLMATFALMQLIFSPVWGSLSDRIGRKPVLTIGVFGFGITMVLFGLSTQLWMLFAARALSGILSSATLPTSMAYIGDSTSEEERGGGMGVIGAAMGLGMVLGPGLGGLLAGQNLAVPFFVAGGLSFLAMVLILLFLPESLPKEERQQGGRVQFINLNELWQALKSPIGILLFLAFLLSFGLTAFEAIFGLYALARFDYGPQRVGTILMVIGFVSAVVQMSLTGPLTRRWGEATVIKVSLLLSAVGFPLMLLANSYLTILVTSGFFMIGVSLLRPAVSSLISRQATVGQGVAMGLNNSFQSMGRIVGPIWAGFIFDLDLRYPYLSGSIVMLLGFIFSLFTVRQEAGEKAPENSEVSGGQRI